jgi:hypothetical protein
MPFFLMIAQPEAKVAKALQPCCVWGASDEIANLSHGQGLVLERKSGNGVIVEASSKTFEMEGIAIINLIDPHRNSVKAMIYHNANECYKLARTK